MRDEGQDMSLLDKCLDGWYEGDKDCSDPSIFSGPKFVSKKVNGDLYLWTWVTMGKFYFYKDGTDKTHLLYKSQRYLTGTNFVFPAELAKTELEPTCNLNDKFGTDPSTGFTGWHLDMKLGDEAISSCTAGIGITALYGRNRCTVRIEYAEGSLKPEDAGIYRTAPLMYKPDARSSFELPDFSLSTEKHRLDGLALAAIGDDGQGHKALYWGESVTPVKPGEVFATDRRRDMAQIRPGMLADLG